MKLYLARHAEAESGAQMDPTRDLTDIGKKQAKMMGKWLARQAPEHKPGILVQSNFHRARATAKRMGKQLDLEPMDCPMGALDPETDPEQCWNALKKLASDNGVDSVLAVTHGPLVERMLAYLTGSPLPQQFRFAHSAIAHFVTTTGKRGVMHWLVTPNVVARDDDEQDLVTPDVTRTVEAALDLVEAVLARTVEAALSG